MSSTSNKIIPHQQQQFEGGSLRDMGDLPSSNSIQISQQNQPNSKRDIVPISLLSANQQKGTSLASVTQISKLLDDYEQYLNLQTNKLKILQSTQNTQVQQPIKKVFENMISPMISPLSSNQQPLLSLNSKTQSNRNKFRSNSNHQPSHQNAQDGNKHQTPITQKNQEMLKRINANKIYQTYTNQDINDTNNSIANLDSILPLQNLQEYASTKSDNQGVENDQQKALKAYQHPTRQMFPSIKCNTSRNYNSLTPKNRLKQHEKRKEIMDEILKSELKSPLSQDEDSPTKSLKLIRRQLPNKIVYQQFTNPQNRHLDLYNDSFFIQESSPKDAGNSPYSTHNNGNDSKMNLYSPTASSPHGSGAYSNLLKQNTKTSQQYIIPKIKYSSQNSYSQQQQSRQQTEREMTSDDTNHKSKEDIGSFHQSLQNPQNDPNQFHFINLGDNATTINSSQVLIQTKKQTEENSNTSGYKSQRERSIRSGINTSRLRSGTKFLPQIHSPSSLQQQNNDIQNMAVSGLGNTNIGLLEEQIQRSKDIYGKKYFKNLKIESLIKEYEKRSIKNLFDAQIVVSKKKNQAEINQAIEEKKQKEQRMIQQGNGKRSSSELLKGHKEGDGRLLQNLQVSLSKSAMTNKLEKDLKQFRERTKSSLLRGVQDTQQNESKADFSSNFQGALLPQNQQLNPQQNYLNQYLINSNRPNDNSEFAYIQPVNKTTNSQRNDYQYKNYASFLSKRGVNSVDLSLNIFGQQNTSSNNENTSLQTPLTATYSRQQHLLQSQNTYDFLNNHLLSNDKDILDNFLKNINIKKKHLKTNDTYTQSSFSPTLIHNNRSPEAQHSLINSSPQELNKTNRQYEAKSPVSIFTNEQMYDQSKTFNEQYSTDSTSYKNTIFPSSTKSKSSTKKKKLGQSNIKTVGQEAYAFDGESVHNGGWETQTNSNFDQLYNLFS